MQDTCGYRQPCPTLELPEPLLIAEDFSFYQRHMPGMFPLLGTGTGIPLHADTFNFDEEVLEQGSMICPNCGETLEFTFDDVEEEE